MTDLSWFFISFADSSGFLGGCYVNALSENSALGTAIVLGINPGGEAMVLGPLPLEEIEARVPESQRYVLLTREQLEAHG